MTFTCGVRFMRFKSSGVSGLASGSFMAAAWRSASVMASDRLESCLNSSVLFMVFSLFEWGSALRARYDANDFSYSSCRRQTGDAHAPYR